MIASIVNDSQSHLSTLSTALRSSTTVTRNMKSSRIGSDTDRVSQVNTGWGKTEQLKSSANTAARQVRTMDTQVQNIAHTMRRLTTDIRAFRKNFPPFPRGSEERERLLNSFQGIRKQIERLTLPPKKETVHGQEVSQSRSLGTLMERYEKLLQTIRERLPAIPTDTSDVAIQKLEQELETLLAFVSQERGERVESGKYYQDVDDAEIAVQMASLSITLGQTFSDQSHWQMTVSQTQLKVLQA